MSDFSVWPFALAMTKRLPVAIGVCLLGGISGNLPAHAGSTLNWQGGTNAASGSDAGLPVWSIPANWAQATIPGSGDSVDFGTVPTTNLTSYVDATYNLDSLTFSPSQVDGSNQAFTVSLYNTAGINSSGPTGILNLANGITDNLAAVQTIQALNQYYNTSYIALANNNVWTTAAGGSLEIDSNVHLGANTLTVSGAGNTLINGQIGGTGGLIYSGTGTLTLAGAGDWPSYYTGGTTINSGKLILKNWGFIGGGAVVDNGNLTIDVGSGNYFGLSNSVSGTGSLIFASGTTIADGDYTHSGGTVIGGTVIIGMQSSQKVAYFGTGTLQLNGQLWFENNSSAGNIVTTSTGLVRFLNSSTAGNANITGTINSAVEFYSNSTAGNATFSNKSVYFEFHDNSSAGNAFITNNSGAEISFFNSSTAAGATILNNGGIDIGAHTGGLSIGSLSGSGHVYSGGNSLTLGALNQNDTFTGDIGNNGPHSSGPSGSLIKVGTGTLTLTGASAYTDGTTISQGSIVARGGTVSGGVLISGALGTGTVTVNSGATLSVGEAPNSLLTNQAVNSLSISALAATLGSSTPLLTFNLGTGATSDLLHLTSSATELTTTGSGLFRIGFSSATGSALEPDSYLLIDFATPQSLDALPALSTFDGTALGNLNHLSSGNTFSYRMSGGQVTGLVYTVAADSAPEPESLWLLAGTMVPFAAMGKRWSGKTGQRRTQNSCRRVEHK